MRNPSLSQARDNMANAERSIRRAMSANSPVLRTEQLTQAYWDTDEEGRDAFAMVLIFRLAMSGRGDA